jgi:hypothetical protein
MRIQKAERVKQTTREGGATRDKLWDASGPDECVFDVKKGTIVVNTTYVNLRDRVLALQIGGEAPRTQPSNETGTWSVDLFDLMPFLRQSGSEIGALMGRLSGWLHFNTFVTELHNAASSAVIHLLRVRTWHAEASTIGVFCSLSLLLLTQHGVVFI